MNIYIYVYIYVIAMFPEDCEFLVPYRRMRIVTSNKRWSTSCNLVWMVLQTWQSRRWLARHALASLLHRSLQVVKEPYPPKTIRLTNRVAMIIFYIIYTIFVQSHTFFVFEAEQGWSTLDLKLCKVDGNTWHTLNHPCPKLEVIMAHMSCVFFFKIMVQYLYRFQ